MITSLILLCIFLRLFLHYQISCGVESNNIYLAYITVNAPGLLVYLIAQKIHRVSVFLPFRGYIFNKISGSQLFLPKVKTNVPFDIVTE